MNYLLDSNTVSDLYNPSGVNHAKVVNNLLNLKSERVFISILTLYEFEYGFANAPVEKRARIKATILQIQQDFPLLPLSTNAAEIFGELKYRYKMATQINQENLKKHTIDFIIASMALSHNLTVISADKIYRDIMLLQPDFAIENWAV